VKDKSSAARRLNGTFALVLLVLVGLLYALWEMHNATGMSYSHAPSLGKDAGDDYDEGAYVSSAGLLLRGLPLFSAVFSAQPAFFLPSLAAVIGVASSPAVGGHLYETLSGLLVLAGVAWMAWTAYRPLAAALGAGLLALSPGFLLYTHAVEAEAPMLALCTLAVAAAQGYYWRGRRLMAVLAGLFLIGGTEMKLLSVVVVPPVGLFLLGGLWRRRQAGASVGSLAGDVLAALLAFVLPAALALVALAPSAQIAQVLTFHLDAGKVQSFQSGDNVVALRVFLGYDPALLLAAAVGLVVALLAVLSARHDRAGAVMSGQGQTSTSLGARGAASTAPRLGVRGQERAPADSMGAAPAIVYALWFLFTLVFLWRYHPTFQHQFLVLLPPLALLGAGLAAAPLAHGRGAGRPALMTMGAPALAGGGAILYLALLGLKTLPADSALLVPSNAPSRAHLAALVDKATRPADYVVADDPMVALTAHRLPPPGIEDPSMVRITAGYLTTAQAVSATERYNVAAVVFSRPKYVHGVRAGTVLGHQLPGYLRWVEQHYREVPSPVVGARVFLRRAPSST